MPYVRSPAIAGAEVNDEPSLQVRDYRALDGVGNTGNDVPDR
jgi:hypothetical protein